MLNSMKISVIVPVYNAEKYLVECLESLVKQTYQNFEIILVNDGSTDNSSKICEEYKKKYKNIKYISIENHGVSYARNLGIAEASGEYLYFMDSDDILIKDCFENFINYNPDSTILYSFRWSDFYKNTIVSSSDNCDFYDYYCLENSLLLDDKISSFLWNKFYNRYIVVQNNLLFDINIHYCEDKIFNIEYLLFISS